MISILTIQGTIQLQGRGFMISLEFSEAKSDADIMVEFWMLRASRILRRRLGEVESLLHLLLSRDPDAYTTLVSHCFGKAEPPCKACQKDTGLFGGCHKLGNNPCANVLLKELEERV
jgi:hypothetical protein